MLKLGLLLLMMKVNTNLKARHHYHRSFHFDLNLSDDPKTRDELTSLGLSKADVEELREVTDTAVNKEDLGRLQEMLDQMSDEELEQLSDMSNLDLEKLYEEQINRSGSKRKKREVRFVHDRHGFKEQFPKKATETVTAAISDEEIVFKVSFDEAGDDQITNYDEDNFKEEDKLRFSSSIKVRREADPEAEPEAEPEAMSPRRHSQTQRGNGGSNREESFLAEYTRRYR